MRVVFASGDVGGARAVLPVMEHCERSGLEIALLENGYLASEAPAGWERWDAERCLGEDVSGLVFSSSVKDCVPLALARRAQRVGIPVVHLLDNWTSYAERMATDGLSPFRPDRYLVMDEIAYKEALAAGVDATTVVITGQPALASLASECEQQRFRDRANELRALGLDAEKHVVLFVSEPVVLDQGASPDSPSYRGYTEKDVLRVFCEALQAVAEDVQVLVLPHPREPTESIEESWAERKGRLSGFVTRLSSGREGPFLADGVAGMASLLLLEAWLVGRPVISIQPGLRLEPLRMLQRRDGIAFVDTYAGAQAAVLAWARELRPGAQIRPRPELVLHKEAPRRVFEIVTTPLGARAGTSGM